MQGHTLVASNDTDAEWLGVATASRLTFTGEPLATVPLDLAVPPRGVSRLPLPAELTGPTDPTTELLAITAGDLRVHHFFAEDRDLALPPARYAADVTPTPHCVAVTITADTLLRDLSLFPDRLSAHSTVDDMLVTLLPGESTTFRVHTPHPLDPAALTTPPVLRTANDLTRP